MWAQVRILPSAPFLQKMTPEGFEPPAFGFGIQRAAVAPWSQFTCEIASVAQLVERSAVNR